MSLRPRESYNPPPERARLDIVLQTGALFESKQAKEKRKEEEEKKAKLEHDEKMAKDIENVYYNSVRAWKEEDGDFYSCDGRGYVRSKYRFSPEDSMAVWKVFSDFWSSKKVVPTKGAELLIRRAMNGCIGRGDFEVYLWEQYFQPFVKASFHPNDVLKFYKGAAEVMAGKLGVKLEVEIVRTHEFKPANFDDYYAKKARGRARRF